MTSDVDHSNDEEEGKEEEEEEDANLGGVANVWHSLNITLAS